MNDIQNEALTLEHKAYYCSQKHTVLLKKKDTNMIDEDPLNIEVISDKGCVPHDLINTNSYLNKLYNSSVFKNFLTKVLGIKCIYPYKVIDVYIYIIISKFDWNIVLIINV